MPRAENGWKICSKCRKNKATSEFYTNPHTSDGYQYLCKACHLASGSSSYQTHREKILAQHKAYTATSEGRKAARAANRRHYRSEKGKATQRRYNQTPKGRRLRSRITSRRRARKAGMVGSYTEEEFEALYELGGQRCFCCGESFPLEELTEDHIEPIGLGVSNRIDNIQLLCGSCNSKKGRQTIDYRPKEVLEGLRRREVRASGHSELPGGDAPKLPQSA